MKGWSCVTYLPDRFIHQRHHNYNNVVVEVEVRQRHQEFTHTSDGHLSQALIAGQRHSLTAFILLLFPVCSDIKTADKKYSLWGFTMLASMIWVCFTSDCLLQVFQVEFILTYKPLLKLPQLLCVLFDLRTYRQRTDRESWRNSLAILGKRGFGLSPLLL